MVHVLIFVHEDVAIERPQAGLGLGVFAQQRHGQGDEVAEIDRPSVALDLLIARVDPGDLDGLLGGDPRRRVVAGGTFHRLGEGEILGRIDEFVLRPRDRGQDVGELGRGIADVLVVPQAQSGGFRLKQFDGLDAIHQPGLLVEAQPREMPLDQISSEGVEGSDPHGRRSLGVPGGDPVREFARGLVREGQDQKPSGIRPLVQQVHDPLHEGLRLAGPGSGLHQGRAAPMPGRGDLGCIGFRRRAGRPFGLGLDRRQQEGVEELLSRHREWRREHPGDLGGGPALVDVQPADDRTGQDELPRKQVHLDLASLTPAVVNDALLADRRGFGRTEGVDLAGAGRRGVAEKGVAEFVRHVDGLLEPGP